MTIDFAPASYRAASSDLSISISPLGLVELADEEFEVHGPRLNRYALNWAMYLGHHWAYAAPLGEAQHTYNWVRTLIDYMNTFTFGKGVQFRSPKVTEGIIPNILKEIWEIHNDKQSTCWEIAQQGSVSGDAFIKIAWDPEFTDTAGNFHEGRVRILPLSAAHCFPEFHPHDKERFVRFKLKYRFWTTSAEGTRQVATYTEIITDAFIEEYINDQLIDQRPNLLGMIPIVHIPNAPIAGSPWGLGDAQDIVSLNRTYNEIASDIHEIINYHAAPITIITGAKASNMERGPSRVWGGLPKEATVFNLEGGIEGISAAMEYLGTLKRAMHEMVGIPETALGQVQPISNTSGVALSIQFQPLMNRWERKTVVYGKGLRKVNEIALRTYAMVHPEKFVHDENDPPLTDGQYPALDLADELTYRSVIHWPPPLPLDTLILMNEIQSKISLGLESRVGALRSLGNESPMDKLVEIRNELRDDKIADGSMNLLAATIGAEIMKLTGMQVGPDGTVIPVIPPGMETGAPGETPVGGQVPQDAIAVAEQILEQDVTNQLVTGAYGTKLAQHRNPDNDADSASPQS